MVDRKPFLPRSHFDSVSRAYVITRHCCVGGAHMVSDRGGGVLSPRVWNPTTASANPKHE